MIAKTAQEAQNDIIAEGNCSRGMRNETGLYEMW